MRVRMIRPAYWTDADLHTRLTAEVREFYIGCWMESDDAGYIDWDVDRLGADLYPYRPLAWRRAHLPKWLALLSASGHVKVLACKRHVVVPNLPKYQAPPKPSYQNKRAHETCVRHVAPDGPTGDQMAPAQEGGSIGEEGNGFIGGPAGASKNGLKAILGDFSDVIAAGKAS